MMQMAIARGNVYPSPGFRRSAYLAGLRKVRIRLGGGVFFGSSGVLFETQNPGRIAKVYCDGFKNSMQALIYDRIYFATEILMVQRLSELKIGPDFFGEVRVLNVPDAVFVSREEKLTFVTPLSGLAYEMEYLDPRQGWRDENYICDSKKVRALDRRVATRIIIDALRKYAILLRAGLVQTDLNFVVNIETGEAKIIDAGGVRKIDINSLARQRKFLFVGLRRLLESVGMDLKTIQALADFNAELDKIKLSLVEPLLLS